jgi:hypothetical protein
MFRRPQCALLSLTILIAAGGSAQVFHVQAGDSTLLNAEGGSVEFKAPNYDGSIGIGVYNGHFEFGAETRYLFHGYTVLAGDDTVPFWLPTDIFDSNHYFSARGAGVTRKFDDQRFYAFAGSTSTWLGTGFFNAAHSESPVELFFYDRKLTDHWRFFSRDIVSNRQTILQGLEYEPQKWLKAGFVAGIGSNQKYAANSLDIETEKLAVKSTYVITGDAFQRITVSAPLMSEVNKGNVLVLYKPNEFVSITTGHENVLQPLTLGGAMQQASVNQLSGDFHFRHFYFGSGLFQSEAEGRHVQGTNFYGGRRIGQRLEVNANYFESAPQSKTPALNEKTTVVSGTVRETFSARFSLLQLVSRSGGQTTFGFGGDFTSNRLMLRADYQNVYLPFRPDRPFEQALALNVAFRVAGPLQITGASNVAPDGRMRYSFGASTYLYRFNGLISNANSPDSFSIAKYLVQGIVKDDQSNPVEGAALHIGKQIVYTDSLGHFMVRFSKRGSYPLSVAPEEFITNGYYQVVSAPGQVRAEPEDTSSEVQVVIRRIPPPQAKLHSQ